MTLNLPDMSTRGAGWPPREGGLWRMTLVDWPPGQCVASHDDEALRWEQLWLLWVGRLHHLRDQRGAGGLPAHGIIPHGAAGPARRDPWQHLQQRECPALLVAAGRPSQVRSVLPYLGGCHSGIHIVSGFFRSPNDGFMQGKGAPAIASHEAKLAALVSTYGSLTERLPIPRLFAGARDVLTGAVKKHGGPRV